MDHFGAFSRCGLATAKVKFHNSISTGSQPTTLDTSPVHCANRSSSVAIICLPSRLCAHWGQVGINFVPIGEPYLRPARSSSDGTVLAHTTTLAASTPRMVCDRCDGDHPSAECPHFRWPRSGHEDAQCLPAGQRPPSTAGTEKLVKKGRTIKMPGDGSCLYHSINHGVRALRGTAPSAATLRRKLAAWARDNSQRKVSGKTMRTWLNWETGGRITLNEYVTRQAKSGWGGVIELIAAAWECEVEVAVWVQHGASNVEFQRTASFEPDGGTKHGTINVCRVGRVHYDYLQLESDSADSARVSRTLSMPNPNPNPSRLLTSTCSPPRAHLHLQVRRGPRSAEARGARDYMASCGTLLPCRSERSTCAAHKEPPPPPPPQQQQPQPQPQQQPQSQPQPQAVAGRVRSSTAPAKAARAANPPAPAPAAPPRTRSAETPDPGWGCGCRPHVCCARDVGNCGLGVPSECGADSGELCTSHPCNAGECVGGHFQWAATRCACTALPRTVIPMGCAIWRPQA